MTPDLLRPKGTIFIIFILLILAFGVGVVMTTQLHNSSCVDGRSTYTHTNHITEQNGLLLITKYTSGTWAPDFPLLSYNNLIATYYIPTEYYNSFIYDYTLQIGNTTPVQISEPNRWIETAIYGNDNDRCLLLVATNKTSGERFIMDSAGSRC